MSTTDLSNAPSASATDTVASTASTEGQGTNPNANASQGSGGDSGAGSDKPINSYSPDDKKKAVLRILTWHEEAYYKILDVPENASQDEIRKAFLKMSLLTHTDRNDDPDATTAFRSKRYLKEPQDMLTWTTRGQKRRRDA